MIVGAGFGEWVFRQEIAARQAGATSETAWHATVVELSDFIGNGLFMSLLKMVLVPLVASSVIAGVASVGDARRLGLVGLATVVYYFITMLMAVLLGVFLVTSLSPGAGFSEEFRVQQEQEFRTSESSERKRVESAEGTGLLGAFRNITNELIPSNPIGAAAEGKLLPVISFSLLVGIAITLVGSAGHPVLAFFESLFAVVMKLVAGILWLAPIGVAALVTWTVARIGMNALVGPLFWFVVTVIVGLAIHALITLPAVLLIFGRTNPYRFMVQMRAALMTAFGTDSSSATLPVTIEAAETLGGCSRRAARFVLPVGATVNMDGTALYEAVAVVFLFQCYGIPLGTMELGIIVITATLAAIGAAGIPSAGLVTMVIVVEAVNHSLGSDKQLPIAAIGVILGIDRLLDMCRTVVNVWGDAVGAKLISRYAPDEPQ